MFFSLSLFYFQPICCGKYEYVHKTGALLSFVLSIYIIFLKIPKLKPYKHPVLLEDDSMAFKKGQCQFFPFCYTEKKFQNELKSQQTSLPVKNPFINGSTGQLNITLTLHFKLQNVVHHGQNILHGARKKTIIKWS